MNNEELVYLYQSGNKKALDMIIENNKNIVFFVSNKFYTNKSCIDIEDLEQEGFMGLIKAAKKYDFNKEKRAKFSTYAVNWIYQKIYNFIIGASSKDKMNIEFNKNCVSLNTPIGEEEELENYIEGVDYSYENLEFKLYIAKLHDELEKVMKTELTLREQEVIKLRNGWNNISLVSQKEVGKLLGISGERVRQIENNSYRKLRRTKWTEENIKEFYKDGYVNKFYRDIFKEKGWL